MRPKRALIFISIILVVFGFWSREIPDPPPSSNNPAKQIGLIKTPDIPAAFFHQEFFYTSLRQAEQSPTVLKKGTVYGGVLPHHAVASDMIAEWFKAISNQPIETVIIVGPDHYLCSRYPSITSLSGWKTPFGTVEPDLISIQHMIDGRVLIPEKNCWIKEHAIGLITPFIKYYLPQARVIPILINPGITGKEADLIVEKVTNITGQGTIVVLSADFSHYMTRHESDTNDQYSLSLIKNRDLNKITHIGDRYLDTPWGLYIFLEIMARKGTTEMILLRHANSSEWLPNQISNTTGYFSLLFQ